MDLLTNNPGALRMLMTEELFLVKEEPVIYKPDIEPTQLAQADIQADFIYLGDNNKYFLIVVNDEKHIHLNKEYLDMLLKIIQAKGLELRDVAILNLNQYPGTLFKDLKDFFVPAKVVLFGIDPKITGLPAMSSNEIQHADQVKILATYHFEEMKSDVNKKREFWHVFKSI